MDNMVGKITICRYFIVICVLVEFTIASDISPRASCTELSNFTFPSDFLFGAGTSAYQIEGAWREGGKGVSFMDFVYHQNKLTPDNGTGDVACNSYYKYKDDIAIAKELKLDYYRFSIAWTRILPTGFMNDVNQEGVDYYNNLIDGLLEAGIQPWVTMYHFDIPQPIANIGGWNNPTVVSYFLPYADLLFTLFGDRVKTWFTFNEPTTFCVDFTTLLTDGTDPFGIFEYRCAKNVLVSHAKIYRLYEMKYKAQQGGRIALVLGSSFSLPATNSIEDIEAAEKKRLFEFGTYAHPLVFGNYPQVVINTIQNYSTLQRYPESRLPDLKLIEQLEIKGAYDFIAINHHTSKLIADNRVVNEEASFENDGGGIISTNSTWGNSAISWLKVYPEGFRLFLNWIKDTYGNPEIVVTEQGFPDDGELIDTGRINYYELYLSEALKAIHEDGVRLTAYTAWSLIDSLEWFHGYTVKFGLYHVDFDSENKTRTAKESVSFFRNVIETRRLFESCPAE